MSPVPRVRAVTRRAAGLLGLSIALPAGGAADAVLAPRLAAWLAARPPIRFAPERNYGPFVFADEHDQVRGLSVEMLALAASRAGLRLATLPPRPLHEHLLAAQRREVDLISSLRPTPERARFLLFTAPYVSVPAVVMVRAGTDATGGLAGLAGRCVAVGQGYAVESVVRERHPAVQWQPVTDDLQALRALHDGRCDGAVADAASVAFVMRRERLGELVSAGPVGFEYPLSFAVRSDWPELREILDIGIRAIGQVERDAVIQRWMPELDTALAGPRVTWATQFGAGLVGLAAVLGAAALWRGRRSGGAP